MRGESPAVQGENHGEYSVLIHSPLTEETQTQANLRETNRDRERKREKERDRKRGKEFTLSILSNGEGARDDGS